MAFVAAHWKKFLDELKNQPIEGLKTLTALLGLFGGLITLAVALIKLI